MDRPSLIPRFPRLPERTLERFLCDDLDPAQAEQVRKAILDSPQLGAYLERRRQEKAAFLSSHSFDLIRERIEPAPAQGFWHSPWLAGWRLSWVAVPMAALVLLVVLLVPRHEQERMRFKGSLSVSIVVKRAERVFEYAPGVVLLPGDRLRLEVEDPEGGFIRVVGINALRQINFYYQVAHLGEAAVEPGRTLLPDSLELDNSTIQEALVVVLSKRQLPEQNLIEWLQQASWDEGFPPTLQTVPDARFSVIPIRKVVP